MLDKMLSDQLADVMEFHLKVTRLPIGEIAQMLVGERRDKALEHLGEELVEFRDATTIADQADALVDLIYVAMGRLLEMGIQPGKGFDLVHEANMRKVSGANKRGTQFEAAKPPGWTPPDWEGMLGIAKGSYIGLSRKPNNPYNHHRNAPKPKVLLLGYGRHGKDTVAEFLAREYDLSFTSSSMVCAATVMVPYFEQLDREWLALSIKESSSIARPPIYDSVQSCFEDRHNHRGTWFKAIEQFNSPDKANLGRAIFDGYDIYCGLRSAREFAAVKNSDLYDVCIWVDRSQHVPPEGRDSCTVEPWMADFVLDNNGTLEDLKFNLDQLMSTILKEWHAQH